MISFTVGEEKFEVSEQQLREIFLEISVAERKVRKDLTDISDKIAELDNLSFMIFRRNISLEMLKLAKLSSQDLFDICFDIVITSDEIKKLDVSTHEDLELSFNLDKILAVIKQKKNYKGFLSKFVDASHRYHHDPEFVLLVYLLQDDLAQYFDSKKSMLGIFKKKKIKEESNFVSVLYRLDYTLDVALDVVSHESGKVFLEMLQEILKHGVSPNIALIQAVKRCDIEFVDELLKIEGVDTNIFAENGDTLLDICVDKGEAIIAEMLLENNADPNLQNKEGETPLLRACKDDNLMLAGLLLDKGADPNLEDHSFNVPLIAAADRGNRGIIDLLFKYNVDWTKIKMLFRAGMSEKRRQYINILIEKSISKEKYMEEMEKNASNLKGIPLETLKNEYDLILQDMEMKDSFSGIITPDDEQDVSTENQNPAIEQYKLDEMLTEAVVKQDIAQVKEALEQGANPNMENPKGLNNTRIIHIIVWHGDLEMLKLVHKYGADINIADVNGDTPIFFAVYKGNQEIFAFLMENGADVYLTNNAGVSAYDLIVDKNLKQFMELMGQLNKKQKSTVSS